MARRYKSIPDGATIWFEGRTYDDWHAVPSHAEHVTLVWWGAKDPTKPATGENRMSIMLTDVPFNTRKGLLQQRIDGVRDDYAEAYPEYGSPQIANASWSDDEDLFELPDDEEFFE